METREKNLEFGISDVEGKQVLYALKCEGEHEQIIQLDSLYDSSVLMELWSKEHTILSGYQTKCIFCGFGNGMYIRRALQQGDDTLRILVYEPSEELFAFVQEHFEIQDIVQDARVKVVVGDGNLFEDELYRLVTYSDLEHLVYQAYPNYDQLFLQAIKEADHAVQIMYNSIRATQHVLDRYGTQYTENGLRNIKHFFDGRSLTDFYRKTDKSIPVIIAASGPSLDKNIEELRAAKGKCLLVGLDSSVRALLRHDIIPDLFVSVDASKNMKNFLDERIKDIPVLCELNSRYELLDMIQAKKFFLNDMNNYVNRFFSRRGILFPVFTTGGSVANTACSVFSSMGFQTIIMVGQDLAYTGNRTHAKDTMRGEWNMDASQLSVTERDGILLWEEAKEDKQKQTYIEVEGYYGDRVKTSHDFQLYLKWFEEQIKENPETTYINATEGGAMIHGANNLSLKEAIEQYCRQEVDAGALLDSIGPLLEEEQKQQFAAYILEMEPKLKELRHLADRGTRHYGKMKELAYHGKYRSREWQRMFEECREISTRLEEEDVMIYVQNIVQRETTRIMEHINEVNEDAREDIIATCEIGESYLGKIREGIDVVCSAAYMRAAQEAAESILS